LAVPVPPVMMPPVMMPPGMMPVPPMPMMIPVMIPVQRQGQTTTPGGSRGNNYHSENDRSGTNTFTESLSPVYIPGSSPNF